MTVGYSGTPLPQKLGIKPGSRVLLIGAPAGFDLGPLPDVRIRRRVSPGAFDVILLFSSGVRSLTTRFGPLVQSLSTPGALWACWPKKASGVLTDLTESAVREHGLSVGLVDVKVAAIDTTWSGLKFVRRLADR
jgi:hypothetical protein